MIPFLFPGEKNAWTHFHSQAKLCLLSTDQGYVLEVSYVALIKESGEAVRQHVVDQYLLEPFKTIEVKAVYPRYSKGCETATFDFKAKLLPVNSKEVQTYAKEGASHEWLADLAELMGNEEEAVKQRGLEDEEVQRRIAYNKSHGDYSNMDPDVKKGYLSGDND